jgi:hypothetical protein
MRNQLWFVVGNTAVPMLEISAAEIQRMRDAAPDTDGLFPIYWSPGNGVWPPHNAMGQIVRSIRMDEI